MELIFLWWLSQLMVHPVFMKHLVWALKSMDRLNYRRFNVDEWILRLKRNDSYDQPGYIIQPLSSHRIFRDQVDATTHKVEHILRLFVILRWLFLRHDVGRRQPSWPVLVWQAGFYNELESLLLGIFYVHLQNWPAWLLEWSSHNLRIWLRQWWLWKTFDKKMWKFAKQFRLRNQFSCS